MKFKIYQIEEKCQIKRTENGYTCFHNYSNDLKLILSKVSNTKDHRGMTLAVRKKQDYKVCKQEFI